MSSGWEGTLNSVMLLDAEGRIKRIYPMNTVPAINLSEHFKIIRKDQKQYLGLALPEQSIRSIKQKKDRYLVIGYPFRRQDGKFAGAWLVSFSLSAVVDKYEKQTRNNEWGTFVNR